MRRYLAAGIVSAFLTATMAAAQDFPSRPITIVYPFAAGGPGDIIARVIAEPMRAALGQPVIVETMPGANGNIGAGRIARAEPNGSTLLLGTTSTHVLNGALYPLQHDVIKDFGAGARSHDVIQFSKNVFDSFASVLAHATQVGQDVVISADADNSVTLKNTKLSAIDRHDFQFS